MITTKTPSHLKDIEFFWLYRIERDASQEPRRRQARQVFRIFAPFAPLR